MVAVLKDVSRVESAEEPIGRAKVLARRPESGVFHVTDDAAISADGQPNPAVAPAPGKVRSQVKRVARPTTARLLRDATDGWSSADIAAVVDEKDTRIREMLSESGERPWAAELFTLIAERAPRLAVRVVLAYVRYLRQLWGDGIIDELTGGLSAMQREEVSSC